MRPYEERNSDFQELVAGPHAQQNLHALRWTLQDLERSEIDAQDGRVYGTLRQLRRALEAAIAAFPNAFRVEKGRGVEAAMEAILDEHPEFGVIAFQNQHKNADLNSGFYVAGATLIPGTEAMAGDWLHHLVASSYSVHSGEMFPGFTERLGRRPEVLIATDRSAEEVGMALNRAMEDAWRYKKHSIKDPYNATKFAHPDELRRDMFIAGAPPIGISKIPLQTPAERATQWEHLIQMIAARGVAHLSRILDGHYRLSQKHFTLLESKMMALLSRLDADLSTYHVDPPILGATMEDYASTYQSRMDDYQALYALRGRFQHTHPHAVHQLDPKAYEALLRPFAPLHDLLFDLRLYNDSTQSVNLAFGDPGLGTSVDAHVRADWSSFLRPLTQVGAQANEEIKKGILSLGKSYSEERTARAQELKTRSGIVLHNNGTWLLGHSWTPLENEAEFSARTTAHGIHEIPTAIQNWAQFLPIERKNV